MTSPTPTTPTKLSFDPERYRENLSDLGLTTQQENELLEAVWVLLVGIIDFQFNISKSLATQLPLAGDSSAVVSFLNSDNKKDDNDAAFDAAAGEE